MVRWVAVTIPPMIADVAGLNAMVSASFGIQIPRKARSCSIAGPIPRFAGVNAETPTRICALQEALNIHHHGFVPATVGSLWDTNASTLIGCSQTGRRQTGIDLDISRSISCGGGRPDD